MAFLNDFGFGLSKTLTEKFKEKDKTDAEVDAYRRKMVIEADAKEALAERNAARLERQRKNYGANPEMEPLNNQTANSIQTLPSVTAPTSNVNTSTNDFMSQFTKNRKIAKDAYIAGDTDYAKGLDADADVLKQQLDQDKYKRTTAREDVQGVEGLSPAKELIKEDSAVLNKNEVNSGLYEKYFGEPKNLNYANPSDMDVEDVKKVKESVVQAAKITSVLSSASADPATGKSQLSSEELKADAVGLVKSKNILLDGNKTDQHEEAMQHLGDILERYPEASYVLNKSLGLDKLTPKAPSLDTQPVVLSNEKPTGNPNVSTTKPSITQDEYMKLPSGSRYTAPDGTMRTKP